MVWGSDLLASQAARWVGEDPMEESPWVGIVRRRRVREMRIGRVFIVGVG